MKQLQSKIGRTHRFTVAATALLSAAWMGSVSAQITAGHWAGGNIQTNDPYYICLNVSPVRTNTAGQQSQVLTAQNTPCRGNQGQNQNSMDVQFQGGVTPDGATCNQYSYRNLEFGDIAINADGTFTTTFQNAWVTTTIEGTFNADNTASGTARTATQWIDCSVNWEAAPVNAATP